MTEQERLRFTMYQWCPRAPDKESSLEQHQRLSLYHHWYEGRAYCTSIDTLPPGVTPL